MAPWSGWRKRIVFVQTERRMPTGHPPFLLVFCRSEGLPTDRAGIGGAMFSGGQESPDIARQGRSAIRAGIEHVPACIDVQANPVAAYGHLFRHPAR